MHEILVLPVSLFQDDIEMMMRHLVHLVNVPTTMRMHEIVVLPVSLPLVNQAHFVLTASIG